MSWLYLILAIILEVCGTTCMKLSQGLTRLTPSLMLFAFYGCSFACVALALKRLEVSTAYAIWSGLGTALIAVIGVVRFRESLTPLKLVGLILVIAGVVALNLAGGTRQSG
jgi:small multidrug resistance pump